MEQGRILRWLKRPGEAVDAGETLFELETDKAVLETPAPASGVLLRVLVEEGDAAVDAVVGWIGEPGEEAPGEDVAPEPVARPARIPATPAARRRAAELQVDLARARGSGPGGRITEDDVEALARSGAADPRAGLIRQLTASWQQAPHIHICRRLDADRLVEYRAAACGRGLDISVTDVLLYAVAGLLRGFPTLCSVWACGRAAPAARVSIGFAVDAGDTVLTPVLEDADRMSLEEIAAGRRALAAAAREKRLKTAGKACFTLTNLGMYGADLFTPVIQLPQSAMLAVGRVAEQAVVRNGGVTAGWAAWATLTVDHRVTDGAQAARFLEALERRFSELGAL